MVAAMTGNPQAAMRGRLLLFGASGTIGRAVLDRAIAAGWEVVCAGRRAPTPGQANDQTAPIADLAAGEGRFTVRHCDINDPASVKAAFGTDHFDGVISCLASRTGVPDDAWAIDHDAQCAILAAAEAATVRHFILLSAICVQKPRLAFQHAKRAFEEKLMASGLVWSIVRPTAYFKSLSGQIDRVRNGKAYLLFGDGRLTACKPISDHDLADFMLGCLDQPDRHNRVLPIGGPGPALTPREMGLKLFDLTGQPVNVKSVPPGMLLGLAQIVSVFGRILPFLRKRAALARIGHYYATESMLVWNEAKQAYDADATPEFGTMTLFDYYEQRIKGRLADDRADHAVF